MANGVFLSQNQNPKGYGYYYNYFAVSCSDFAPAGWTVPVGGTGGDVGALYTTLGGFSVAGGKLKATGTTYWCSPNTGADNSSGFCGLGGGYRKFDGNGASIVVNEKGYVWGLGVEGGFRSIQLNFNDDNANYFDSADETGMMVRFIYTGASSPSTVSDYEGNVYDTVVIGSQRWTVQNWKSRYYNDGTPIPKVKNPNTWTGLTTGAYAPIYNNEIYV